MSMQSHMANDLREVFERDMPAECKIGAQTFSVLIDDLLNEEVETTYGGPESLDLQRVHFQASQKSSIEINSPLAVRQKAAPGAKLDPWKSKIVLSSILSADGNELIATVRGD